MASIKKVLLINTHLTYPNFSEGTLNKSFYNKAKDFFESKSYQIIETHVEAGYNPEEEVEKYLLADIVILQMPVNWFGAPWIFKKYIDEVFNYALYSQKMIANDEASKKDTTKQYGSNGKMQGKKFMICATFAAPKVAFGNQNQDLMKGKTIADLFLNITSTYKYCGYDILESYQTFNIYKDNTIEKDLENYPKHLASVLNLN